jgi:hypothetical protein
MGWRKCTLVVLVCGLIASVCAEPLKLDIVVPPFEVKGKDAYICTTVPLPARPYKLVGIEPIAEQSVVHHILLFGERTCPFQRLPRCGCLLNAIHCCKHP